MGMSIGIGPFRFHSGKRRTRRTYTHQGCWRKHTTQLSATECGKRNNQRRLTRDAEVEILTAVFQGRRADYRIAQRYAGKTLPQLIRMMHRPVFGVPLERLSVTTEDRSQE